MNHDIIKFIDNIDYKDIEFKYKEFDLILSGGGLKGFYHIGMCKILREYEKEGKILFGENKKSLIRRILTNDL